MRVQEYWTLACVKQEYKLTRILHSDETGVDNSRIWELYWDMLEIYNFMEGKGMYPKDSSAW